MLTRSAYPPPGSRAHTRSPGAHPSHAAPDVDHLSRHLEPEDVRDALGRRVLPPPLQQVGAVERRRLDPDEELVLLHDGIGVLPDVEDLDAAQPAHQHRFHRRRLPSPPRFVVDGPTITDILYPVPILGHERISRLKSGGYVALAGCIRRANRSQIVTTSVLSLPLPLSLRSQFATSNHIDD